MRENITYSLGATMGYWAGSDGEIARALMFGAALLAFVVVWELVARGAASVWRELRRI